MLNIINILFLKFLIAVFCLVDRFQTSMLSNIKHLEVQNAFKSICSIYLFNGCCTIVKAPNINDFSFQEVSDFNDANCIMREEIDFGKIKYSKNYSVLNKFIGGRIALRRSLCQLSYNVEKVKPILTNDLGAPVLPKNILGSISHKNDFIAGIIIVVNNNDELVLNKKYPGSENLIKNNNYNNSINNNNIIKPNQSLSIGIDIEKCKNKSFYQLQKRILTINEQNSLGNLFEKKVNKTKNNFENNITPITIEEEVLLLFSFKESFYKAMNPLIKTFLNFNDVEIFPKNDGSVEINFLLKSKFEHENIIPKNLNFQGFWQRFDENYWLTCIHISTK
jgi:4'-phosphopantetheinyl transferase EntD